MNGAYYNENDPFAAAWLRELIRAGLIADGDVDERSIEDVQPDDIRGYGQCHFFAGIGGWSYALRLAGWPDDRPVWTGSCPCQPFSAAGRRKGTADKRHLWPQFFRLIRECRPAIVFGEQVASKDGLAWLDAVCSDLEGTGYAVGAANLCAAGVGAPHIRQRLYWVGIPDGEQHDRRWNARATRRDEPANTGDDGRMADADNPRLEGRQAGQYSNKFPAGPRGLENFWGGAGWIACRDGKSRPVESQPRQMANGIPDFMGFVRSETQKTIEEKIDEWEKRYHTDARKALRNLWEDFSAEAIDERNAGRSWKLYEAPFLLSFLRQLKTQGWKFADALPCQSQGKSKEVMRFLRIDRESLYTPCRRELGEQQSGESANALQALSQLLAHYETLEWSEAIRTYAGRCFPLTIDKLPNRVVKLRGYGNAIVPQVAKAFIETVMEFLQCSQNQPL